MNSSTRRHPHDPTLALSLFYQSTTPNKKFSHNLISALDTDKLLPDRRICFLQHDETHMLSQQTCPPQVLCCVCVCVRAVFSLSAHFVRTCTDTVSVTSVMSFRFFYTLHTHAHPHSPHMRPYSMYSSRHTHVGCFCWITMGHWKIEGVQISYRKLRVLC